VRAAPAAARFPAVARRALWLLGLWCLAGCEDPRVRPVTPTIQLRFAPGQQVVSPGVLPHEVYVVDQDGIGQVRVRIGSADSTLSADSTRLPPDAFESTLSYRWDIPAGIAAGTAVRVIASVTDLTGFSAADTVDFQVEPTTP
jgi:hypothetical protein